MHSSTFLNLCVALLAPAAVLAAPTEESKGPIPSDLPFPTSGLPFPPSGLPVLPSGVSFPGFDGTGLPHGSGHLPTGTFFTHHGPKPTGAFSHDGHKPTGTFSHDGHKPTGTFFEHPPSGWPSVLPS